MNLDFVVNGLAKLHATRAWLHPLSSLVGAFVFGQLLAWTYERTYSGLSYSRGFSHTLVLICISASILVLSMSESLFAGIGLFGVLSMIRFRTDLKTSRDLVFVMGSACVGIASGVHGWIIGFSGTLVFSSVALYLAAGPFGSRSRFDGVLRFHVDSTAQVESVLPGLLSEFCRRSVLLSSVEVDSGRMIEHVYQVKFFRQGDHSDVRRALREELQAQNTRLMLQDSTTEY
jgi:hypothetical protein